MFLGHDFIPMVFSVNADNQLSTPTKLDAAVQKEAETMSAMAKFRSMDKQAWGSSSSKAVSTHENAIKYVPYPILMMFDDLVDLFNEVWDGALLFWKMVDTREASPR